MPDGSAFHNTRLLKEKQMITTNSLDTFWKEYAPHAVGLDDVFNRLEAMSGTNVNYPPYNLIKHDSSNFSIEIALAGFKSEEIEVSTEQSILRVASKVEKRDSERTYLHKGLSKRSFVRTWQLSEDVEISNVDFQDGLLTIDLQRIVPEKHKRKIYEISATEKQLLTEG
jgi:molecular chaperone IbpA